MKKNYVTPSAEAVRFQYSEQVVAESGGCPWQWRNMAGGGSPCEHPEQVRQLN